MTIEDTSSALPLLFMSALPTFQIARTTSVSFVVELCVSRVCSLPSTDHTASPLLSEKDGGVMMVVVDCVPEIYSDHLRSIEPSWRYYRFRIYAGEITVEYLHGVCHCKALLTTC